EGQTQIDGRTVNTLVLTTPKNVKIKMHFDAASGLLAREELPAGEITRVFEYADFQAVDGVMEPHLIRVSAGQERFEIKLDQISHNPQLDRAAFEFPKLSNEPLPDITALLKQLGENEDELDRLLEKYTYTETITEREIASDGQMKSKETKVYELTF